MFIEHAFAHSVDTASSSFMKENNLKHQRLYPYRFPKPLKNCYQQLDDIEKTYYNHYLSFAAREQTLAKNRKQDQKLPMVWQHFGWKTLKVCAERFSILSHLHRKMRVPQKIRCWPFEPTHFSNALSNFRKGDVVVLYPSYRQASRCIESSGFKCNLVSLSNHEIVLRLRSPNAINRCLIKTGFVESGRWCIGQWFRHMYKTSSFSFRQT